MMLKSLLQLPLLVLFACVSAAPPRGASPSRSLFQPTGVPQRVVLLSFDGLGADALERQRGLTSFARVAQDGLSARVIPVNPTLTGPTHVSILTGAEPEVHGIVSNRFHIPGTPPDEAAHGIDAPIAVETLVQAARRQGKRVGAVPFPTVDGRSPQRTADFGLAWTPSLTQARVVKLTRADFRREWVPPTWTSRPQRRASYSPVMRARLEWGVSRALRRDVDVVAYDTTDDRAENYDLYVIESEDREIPMDARGWFALSWDQHGSWSRFLDRRPSLAVTLYWGAISRTLAYPQSFRDLLDREAGFWPGVPDDHAEIDAGTFGDQVDRLADFLSRAQTLAIQRMEFDLLLTYQPAIDQATHRFLGSDALLIQRAFRAADRAAAALGGELDANRDALILTGDHGLVPIEREVHLGRLLADHGFASHWRAFISNSVAHLVRFGGPDDTDALVTMLQASGFFERIERKTPRNHRNSGDLVLMAYPSVSLTSSTASPDPGPPGSGGQHGGLSTHPELHTVFFAAGFGIPRGRLETIPQTRLVRFVSALLGIQPPAGAH